MYSLETLIVAGAIGWIAGSISILFLSKKGVTLEKRVSLVVLGVWLSFATIGYLQDQELSIFFNAIGSTAFCNLIGVSLADFAANILSKGNITKRK